MISVVELDDNSILAFSAASYNLCKAIGSFLKSTPSSFWNSSAIQLTTFSSIKEPPKSISPSVALISKIPSATSTIDKSIVHPPKS